MPRAQNVSAENNFTGGLKTEFTGLNFPENACTETYNCVFHRVGSITRRKGFAYETNFTNTTIARSGRALNSYTWLNADGTGAVHLQVVHVGGSLLFYAQSSATTTDPLSDQKLASTITLSAFSPSGGTSPDTVECQFADGNGYLFVFHPYLEPFFCTYSGGTVTATQIDVKIRDFKGLEESGVDDALRSSSLTATHQYNLANQGWGKNWSTTSVTPNTNTTGNHTFAVSAGLPIAAGDRVIAQPASFASTDSGRPAIYLSGLVVSYSGTSLVLNGALAVGSSASSSSWTITPDPYLIPKWFSAIGNYPSNADVWWRFKNSDDYFDPKTMVSEVTANGGRAPRGYFIMKAFDQQRDTLSSISGIADVTITARPSTGTWFAGRVWYAGVNYQEFNEDIYFSQIIEQKDQFGKCYQRNDPTGSDFFDLLPTDGGVIKVPGIGQIFKLIPIQNGLLVFGLNGVWFITGSQGIGFTANDYALVKLASIPTISHTSFVIVNGFPIWWNEQGIYMAKPGEQGISIENLSLTTIQTFYDAIPLTCKLYARGDYDPVNMKVMWTYRSDRPSDLTAAYDFDRVLNLDLQINAFFPWAIAPVPLATSPFVHGVKYIKGTIGATGVTATFKFLTSAFVSGSNYTLTFSEEKDSTTYVDWGTTNYSSYFKTGYKLHGQAQKKFQSSYVYTFSDNTVDTQYQIRGIWNFANSPNSGTYSVPNLATINRSENVTVDGDYYGYVIKRHKVRGHGLAMQIHVFSVAGKPFNLIGWSVWETSNQHV